MSYVAHITLPIVFAADDDNAARVIVELLRAHLADASIRFGDIPADAGPEVSDYPDAELQEVLPYVAPRPVPVEVTTDRHTECSVCYLPISPVETPRCERCLGCANGSRCELPAPVLCVECQKAAQS